VARIRTIKPEFWQDYQLARQFTRDQRLLYIALWNEADDEGRFQAHPARLKGVVFPYDDDLHGAFIEGSLRALARAGKVILYVVDGEPYGELVHFLDHQRINRPTPSRIPPPDKALELFTEDSLSHHGPITEPSLPEGKGKEGEKEREKEYKTSVFCAFEKDFFSFWEAYPNKVGRKKSLEKYQLARRRGHDHAEIMDGLGRYLAFKNSTGQNLHNPATFLGQQELFTEPWTIPEAKTAEEKRGNGPGECTVDPKFKRTWAPVITERRVAEPAERGPVGNVRVELPGRGGT